MTSAVELAPRSQEALSPPRREGTIASLKTTLSSGGVIVLVVTSYIVAALLFARGCREAVASDKTPGAPATPPRPAIATASFGCEAAHRVREHETLAEVSQMRFGQRTYDLAVLLATNMRSSLPPYAYVETPEALKAGSTLCIPSREEARILQRRFESYAAASRSAMRAAEQNPARPLSSVTATESTKLVSWMRRDDWLLLKRTGQLSNDTWVTLAPKLQQFCRTYAQQNAPGVDELILRLEQRLGLPPASGKAAFVEFNLSKKDAASLRRPCRDPSTTSSACAFSSAPSLTEALKKTDELGRWYWFLRQYYVSYSQPYQYPWTGAGETFDWAATDSMDRDFVRWGEAEFIVPEQTPVANLQTWDVGSYCGL